MENNNFENRDFSTIILSIIRSDLSNEQIKLALDEYHDNDIASVLEELTTEEKEKLLDILGNEKMSEIISYLDDASSYLSSFDDEETAEIIQEMDADEALEILDDLDEETKTNVLELIEDEEIKEDILMLDSYDDDEIGSKMSTNFIVIKKDSSIKKAMKTLIEEAAENDNIYTIFVVDENNAFYGAVDLKDLIVARSSALLDDFISTNFPYVFDNDMISENIERIKSYEEDLIPVISHKNNELLGVITAQDIIEIVDEELGDDYAKFAGLSSEVEADEKLIKSIMKRIPWLIILLFLGLLVSAVVGMFESVVDALPIIVSFQSLILGMAGNVGTQSLAVTVRSLGLKEKLSIKEQFIIIFKEMRVAFFNGLIVGIISFLIVGIYLLILNNDFRFSADAAGCVGCAMCIAMLISGFTGATIPLTLYRFGIDPAVASGPLITTINDLMAVISYYGLAWLLLINLS